MLGSALWLAACHHVTAPPDGGLDAKSDKAKADAAAGVDAQAEAAPEVAEDAPAEAAPDAPAEKAPDAAAEADPACLTIPTDATRKVHLRITADNECEVFVNGADVGMTTSWPSPVTLDVSLFVHPGKVNVIGVMARNTSSQGGNDRGIIGALEDVTDAGSKVVIVTDGAWKSSKVERS